MRSKTANFSSFTCTSLSLGNRSLACGLALLGCLVLPPLASAQARDTAGAQQPAAELPNAPVPVAGQSSPLPGGAAPGTSRQNPAPTTREQAEEQLKRQEKQRILGIMPNFNTSYDQNAAPLSSGQKYRLAFRSMVDPFEFVAAAADAGISQAEDNFPGYGQGAKGYFKRFGAAYADSALGTFWGNALFPVLLKEDPRYFRKGTGSFTHRVLYSAATTVWCKRDNGTWGPNYGNVLGNIVAGGFSNLYYPSTDRGVGLTFERAFTVTAEGTLGALFNEFWPDVARKWLHKPHDRAQAASETH